MSIYWFPIRISYLISPFPQYCDPLYEGEFNLLSTDYGDSSLVKYTELTLCTRFLSLTSISTLILVASSNPHILPCRLVRRPLL